MPASNAQKARGGGQLPTVMFWTGVGLAPVAAALLLLSTGAAGLRVAAVLTILTVVLVGLSIMLRPDAVTVRLDLEDQLYDEIDTLREDIRKDIAGAARATHRAYSEKLQTLYQTVDALRTQVEALRAGTPEPAPASVGSAMVAGGVVRHTETVQVTTRQMIVDQERSSGTVYGSRAAEPATATRPAHSAHSAHSARPPEESWTEQRLRERLAEVRSGDSHRAEHEPRRPRPYERDESYDRAEPRSHAWTAEPTTDPLWGGTDRWAATRTDDRGQELRIGTRRAEVRSDEVHVEDRWAQVRRDERNDWDRPEPRWERGEPPAITATGPEPAAAWTQGWRDEPATVNPRPRRPDYEMSDNRWR